MKSADLLEVN